MSHVPEIPLQQSQPTIADLAKESTMDLLLWRHAEAEDGFPDSERKLTPRGEEQARRMAAWIKAHAPKDLRVVASPAKRCQQTAQALGLPFDTDSRLGTGNPVADLLAAARAGGARTPPRARSRGSRRNPAIREIGRAHV